MKVAIYCRLSEEDKNKQFETDDSESIQNQKSMLIQYALERQWEICHIYSDDDFAGADRKRPAFNALLQDAENHQFDIILCKTQSRFTRELELVEKYIHGLFPIWNIRFISIVDNADTEIKGNKKSRQINGLVNEWYLEDMSENIKSVLTNKRENGIHIGSFALYGYKKDSVQKGHLLIDEDAAKVVREVFSLFAQGYGKTKIAKILNDREIPNPTEYKRLHGLRYQQAKSKNSTLWKYSAISHMLKNEIYIGHMVQGKYGSVSYKTKENKALAKEQWIRVLNTHEAIIDATLWYKVQNLIAKKAKPFTVGTIGLFAHKAVCMHCGCTLCSTKNKDKRYLQCAQRHISKDSCVGAFISEEKLEQALLCELLKMAEEYLDIEQVADALHFDYNTLKIKKKLEMDIVIDQKKAQQYIKALADLYLDKAKAFITSEDYIHLSKNFSTERERLEKNITERKKHLSDLEYDMQKENSPKELVEEYIKITSLNREIIELFIDYIAVGKRLVGTRQIPIEIHWNF